MSRLSIISIVSATLLAAGAAYFLQAGEQPKRWPKPTPPPPPSPIYQEVTEAMPGEEEIAKAAAEHNARLHTTIELALAGDDRDRLETAFVFLLPELLQLEPRRVVAIHAAQKPGPARDRLRDAIARQWTVMDRAAATDWIRSLPDDDRRAAAKEAIATLRPIDSAQATLLAKELASSPAEEATLLSSR